MTLEHHHADAFGIPLEIGDTVLHFFNEASEQPTICVGAVVGSTLKRVRIEISDSRQNGVSVMRDNEIKLAKPQTLVRHKV